MTKKKKVCSKGYSCGASCISVIKMCRVDFPVGVGASLEYKSVVYSNPFYKPEETKKEKIEKPTSLSEYVSLGENFAKKFLTKGGSTEDEFKNVLGDLISRGKQGRKESVDDIANFNLSKYDLSDYKSKFQLKNPKAVTGKRKINTVAHLEEFLDLMGGMSIFDQIKFIYEDSQPWAYKGEGYIKPVLSVGDNKKDSIFHEMGHHLEYNDQTLKKAAREFLKSRATGPVKSLNSIVGKNKFEANERAFPGNFIDPYVGKIYSDGHTEVVSVGLQYFADSKKMQKLYKKDPEYFNFIVGTILANQG